MIAEHRVESGWDGDAENLAIVIPTLNAEPYLGRLLPALADQGIPKACFLVVDSASTDRTVAMFDTFGAEIVPIARATFNHGGTRRLAVSLRPQARFIVMLTQDAIPATPQAIRSLLEAFDDSSVGMAYGRQLPRLEAGGIERHARLFNYPERSMVRGFEDRAKFGVKTVFCSDSFAVYRRTALEEVGGFPEDAYFAEDQIIAGRMLQAAWKLAYQADATVYHSHGYSVGEDFRRYFDVGVYHGRNRWLIDAFGRAEKEGGNFVKSELAYLARHYPERLPSAVVRIFAKYAGYQLGLREEHFSIFWKRRLSMQPFYWK